MTTDSLDPRDAAAAALDRVLAGLDELGGVAGWQMSDDALAATVRRLDRVSRLAHAQLVRVAAEAGSRGLPGQRGHRRLDGWIRELVPTATPRVAAAAARRADRLYTSALAADLGPTREAMLAGDISAEQVDIIADTVAALVPPAVPAGTLSDHAVVEAQGFLLEQAEWFEPKQLHRLATHLRHRLDPDADDRLTKNEEAQQGQRSFTLADTLGGMVHVEGLLTPACGQALRTAIDAWAAPAPAADGTPDPRTGAQRRHDSLQLLAEKVIACPDLLPNTHGSPYRIVVTVPHETLAAALHQHPGQHSQTALHEQPGQQPGLRQQSMAGLAPATLPDGTPLSATTLATLTCGADLLPILIDELGNPLDVGLTQRMFPTKQRIAITHRDRHCTYPGCRAPASWCDAHHVIHFRDDGTTSVINGALLCGHHHRHVHQTGITGRLINGQIHWNIPPPGGLSGAPPGSPGQPGLSPPALATAVRLLDNLTRRWRTP